MSEPRRNEPCPCGSARRYKDCHGRLAAEPPGVEAQVQAALGAHQRGRIDEAQRAYREILAREPGHAVATHYLGLIEWQRGDAAKGEALMRASIGANATIPDFHNNLGLLLRDTQRAEEALVCFRAALAANPAWFEAYNNLGLALEAMCRWEEAAEAYREAIAGEPRFAAARQNLARLLIRGGDFAAGWSEYRWRLFAQGLATAPPDEATRPLPACLAGRSFALVEEQGIGDVLFFLRFAAELARRGARLAFGGGTRLFPLLARTGLFALGMEPESARLPEVEVVQIGDLPWLLGMKGAVDAPTPLALAPEPDRLARLDQKLLALGPHPWVALTWRAGVESAGPSKTQLKEVDLDTLGAFLQGRAATWISVQRFPRGGERERLESVLEAPVHDFSAANDDLEEMLALMSLVDDYVGVSNANTHLRAGTGKPMQVLVAHPPEWRWGVEGDRSVWFPWATVFRQGRDGGWEKPA
ncbi:MAG: tetratricopeptide repeat protein [Usitatibacter sp.]